MDARAETAPEQATVALSLLGEPVEILHDSDSRQVMARTDIEKGGLRIRLSSRGRATKGKGLLEGAQRVGMAKES